MFTQFSFSFRIFIEFSLRCFCAVFTITHTHTQIHTYTNERVGVSHYSKKFRPHWDSFQSTLHFEIVYCLWMFCCDSIIIVVFSHAVSEMKIISFFVFRFSLSNGKKSPICMNSFNPNRKTNSFLIRRITCYMKNLPSTRVNLFLFLFCSVVCRLTYVNNFNHKYLNSIALIKHIHLKKPPKKN